MVNVSKCEVQVANALVVCQTIHEIRDFVSIGTLRQNKIQCSLNLASEGGGSNAAIAAHTDIVQALSSPPAARQAEQLHQLLGVNRHKTQDCAHTREQINQGADWQPQRRLMRSD